MQNTLLNTAVTHSMFFVSQLASCLAAYVNIINFSFVRPDCSYTRGSYNLADSGIELTASQAAVLKASIAALKAKQPNTRVLLSVGGGNQEYNRWDRMNLDCLKGIVDGFGFHGTLGSCLPTVVQDF